MLGDRGAHLRRCTDRAQRVILVRDGDAEDGHDRVADELLDRPSVALEDDAKVLEVAPHTCTQRLRLAERRGADEVAEEDRDDLALLSCLHDGERSRARHAEARLIRVLRPAIRARRHHVTSRPSSWYSCSSMATPATSPLAARISMDRAAAFRASSGSPASTSVSASDCHAWLRT